MKGWQRKARFLIGLFTVIFGTAVFLTVGDRTTINQTAVIEGLDPEAILEGTGTVVTQTTGDTRNFTVEAERQLTYADAESRLEVARITIEGRTGEELVITGKQGEVGEAESLVAVTGDVLMRATDGLTVTTQHASYNQPDGIVRVPGYMEFSRGKLSGSAIGANYSNEDHLIQLLAKSRVEVGLLTIESIRAELTDGHMRFTQGVQIEQLDWKTFAEQATVYYDVETGAVGMVELRGQARLQGVATTLVGLESMSARDIDLTYDDLSGLIRHASLAGESEILFADTTLGSGQRIGAEFLEATLAADGVTVIALSARERVEVTLPESNQGVAKRILSARMQGFGNSAQGLTAAEFIDDVGYHEIRFSHGEPAEVITRADRLETSLSGTLNSMANARFTGQVTFRDGSTDGKSGLAFYDMDADMIRLRSYGGDGSRPRVTDPNGVVEADAIDLGVGGGGMSARGNVRTVLTFAGIFKSSEPSYGAGERLSYDPASGLTTYSDGARLWQGATAVQGDRIELFQETADLKAIGNARSSFILQEIDDVTQEVEEVLTIGVGKTMQYEELMRRATYTTHARVNGPQGDLTGHQVELYFGQSRRELERVESRDRVKLILPNLTATGMQLTYFTTNGRYVMHGTPVQVLEELPDECRDTRGKTLTFFRSSNTVSVDSDREVRTQTNTFQTTEPESLSGNREIQAQVQSAKHCPQPQYH